MDLWFLAVVGILLFALLTLCRRWYDYSMLFTFAIGFAVNANIYNSVSSPVEFYKLIFAIDSILYTGFAFTVIICAKEYGIKKAKILTLSAIAAVILSAIIELFASISSFGFDSNYFKAFFGYIASAIGTFVGFYFMICLFDKFMKKKINIYLSMFICVLIASIINSTIYYSYSLIVYQDFTNFLYILLGSYLGKLFAINLGMLSYYVNTHLWIPLDLKNRDLDLENE